MGIQAHRMLVELEGKGTVAWLGACPSQFLPMLLEKPIKSSYRDPNDLKPASAGRNRQDSALALTLVVA